MPYSIQTKDGIKINNIPDDIPRDSDVLRERVAAARAQRQQQPQIDVAAMQAEREAMANRGPVVPADPDVPITGAYGRAVVRQPEPRPEPTIGEMVIGGAEAARALVTGATTGAIGGAKGFAEGVYDLARSGKYGTREGAQQLAASVTQGMQGGTIMPKTETGQRYLQNVAQAAEPLAHLGALAPLAGEMSVISSGLRQAGPAIRDRVAGAADDVAAAASGRRPPSLRPGGPERMPIMSTPPMLIDERTGYPTPVFEKALKAEGVAIESVIDDLPKLPYTTSPRRAARDLVVSKLRSKAPDAFLATKALTAKGDVVDDVLAQQAVKQGFREGDVQAIKIASPATRAKMNQMLNIKRRIYSNERVALDERPANVIGDSALSRIDHIRRQAGAARLELDGIARRRLADKAIDVDSIRNQLFSELDNLDVEFDRENFTGKRSDYTFEGSMISRDKTSQRVIRDVIDLLAEDRAPTALRAHKLKRQLDTMIDFRSRDAGGLTESGERIARSIRTALNQAVRNVDEDYARVNDTLSASIGALEDFQRAMGPSVDIRMEGSNSAIGQELRGLMSNNKTRMRLENALSRLDDTAVELGGQFDDDIRQLVLFDKTLDEKFGATARRGFAGETESAVARGVDIATGGKAGLAKAGIDLAKEKINQARNINDYQAFKTLDELLKRREN